MTLYFDANGSMGDHAIGYAAYEGKMRVRPLFVGKQLLDQEDEKYAGYNQYMFKFEAILQAIKGVRQYVRGQGLVKYHGEVTVDLCSQHKTIHNMLYSRSHKEPYTGIISEILELVDKLGEEGIITNITNVKGEQNMAKKIVKECLASAKQKPKQLTNTKEKLLKSQENVRKNNVIDIDTFKVV